MPQYKNRDGKKSLFFQYNDCETCNHLRKNFREFFKTATKRTKNRYHLKDLSFSFLWYFWGGCTKATCNQLRDFSSELSITMEITFVMFFCWNFFVNRTFTSLESLVNFEFTPGMLCNKSLIWDVECKKCFSKMTYLWASKGYCGLRMTSSLGRICMKTRLTQGAILCVCGDRKWTLSTTTVTHMLELKQLL